MKQWFALIFFVVFSLQIQIMAQARRSPVLADHPALVESGVVVDEVERGKEADAAGLKEGDVLLSWSRDGAGGEIESPFDFIWVDIDQRPRGEITVAGLRGGEKRSWKLGGGEWGLATRPNFAGTLAAVYRRSRAMEKAGNPSGAARYWSKASSRVPLDEVAWLPAWAAFHTGKILAKSQQQKSQKEAYLQALHAAGEEGHVKLELLWLTGGMLWTRGELSAAGRFYQQALELEGREGGNTVIRGRILSALGLFAVKQHDDVAAEEYYLQAINIEQDLAPQSDDLSVVLTYLACLYWAGNDISHMLRYSEPALAIMRKSGAKNNYVLTTNLLLQANAALSKGDFSSAESYFRELFEAAEKGNPGSLDSANGLNGLGIVAEQRGDFRGAERYFRKALTIEEKFKLSCAENGARCSAMNLAVTLGNVGLAEDDQGKFGPALGHYRRALSVFRKCKIKNISVATVLNNMGQLVWRLGRPAAAEIYLKQALALENRELDSDIKADTLHYLAVVMQQQGKLTEAASFFEEGARVAKKVAPGSATEADMLAGLARLNQEQRKADNAAALYERAMAALESQTARLGGTREIRAEYRARHTGYYREYIDLLISQNKPSTAFRVLERSRARTLLEMLAATRLDVHQGADPDLLKRERTLRDQISAKVDRRVQIVTGQVAGEPLKAVEDEISDLTKQYQEVEAQLRTSSPAYAALTQPQPLTAEQVQHELLDSDTVLLEYSLGEKRSYVFAVTPTELDVVALPGRRTIERLAMRLHDLMKTQSGANKQRSEAQYERTAAALARMVLKPVAEQIRGKRIVVVADGALHYVPFASLPDPGEGNGRMKAMPLIAGHEVVNLPSASVLAILRRQEKTRESGTKAVAVLADPVFDKQDQRVLAARAAAKRRTGQTETVAKVGPVSVWNLATPPLTRSAVDVGLGRDGQVHLPRLRFTRLEANAILAVTPPGAGKEALDFDASRTTAMSPELSQYRIIHFATHGLLDSRHPELSGLVFSLVDRNGRAQNGFLDLQDIYNLNLHADLVVLSACETGLGKQISGEGIVGLTRGFMYAGASRVVASLWKVSDVATARLMTYFYQGMEKEGLTPAAALRAAQIKMLSQQRWRNPYYWAAFQIQGEWK